jgi:hypothetical protein
MRSTLPDESNDGFGLELSFASPKRIALKIQEFGFTLTRDRCGSRA